MNARLESTEAGLKQSHGNAEHLSHRFFIRTATVAYKISLIFSVGLRFSTFVCTPFFLSLIIDFTNTLFNKK